MSSTSTYRIAQQFRTQTDLFCQSWGSRLHSGAQMQESQFIAVSASIYDTEVSRVNT